MFRTKGRHGQNLVARRGGRGSGEGRRVQDGVAPSRRLHGCR